MDTNCLVREATVTCLDNPYNACNTDAIGINSVFYTLPSGDGKYDF